MGTSGAGEKGNAIIDFDGMSQNESEDSNTMSAWKAYWRVFTYAGPMEYAMLAVASVAAVASGVGIASQNIIFGEFVTAFTDFGSDKAAAANFRDSGAKLALYFFYLGVGRLVVAYVYNALLTYSAYRIVRNIRHDYLKSALRQEIAYFDFGTSGSIATKAYSNGRLVQNGISEKLGLTIQGFSAFLSSFIIAFITNWKLTLIICAIAPLTVIVMCVCAFIQAGYETKTLDCYAGANSFAEGVIASIRTVHAFEMRSRLVDKFDQFLKEAHFWGNKMSILFGILFSAEYTIIYCGNALAFWRGIHMLASGEIANTGDVFTVLLSVVIAALSITQLAPYSIEFTRAASAAAQLFVLIDRQTEIDPFDPSGEQPPSLEGDVELEGVTFAYPTRPNTIVLDNFTLKAPAGKVTALVGHSGSGKSTIVGLIERWYNPASGAIKLDGRPIDSLNISWLRRNIRLVQQEPVLFRGSVFDNIVHGLVGTPLEKAPREEQMKHVVEAAKIAYADDFIAQLPNGYDTDIGQRGGLLSGGQKQRVAIARSLVSNPKVLLLDEATSALDPYAESIVQEALERASAGRTTIVIAHKLATIRKADNIVVMSAGQIIEQGTHESLIAMEGAYARLVAVQNLHVSNDNSPDDSDVEASSMEGDSRLQTSKSLTRYPTADQGSIDIQPDYNQYDDGNFKQLSLLGVVWRLIVDNPDMKWAYLAIFWGCFFSAGLFPGQAILMANMVDVFTLSGPEMIKRGDFFAAMFVVLAGGALLSYYVMGWGTNTLAQTLAHNLRKQIFNDILRQDLEYFDRPENSTGALASRVDSYPQAVFELMGFNIGFILIAAINILACSLLGIIFAWKLGLVIVFGGSTAVVGFGFAKMFFDGRLDRAVTKRLSTSSAIASESTNAIRTVSSLGIEGSVLSSYLYELDTAITKSVKPLLNMMVWFALSQCSEFWFMALGFWYGSRLVSFREITLFEFFVSFMAVFFCAQATSQIFQFSTSITKGKNGANAMFWLQQLQPTMRETPENKDKGPKSGGPVALEDVKFAYPLRPDTRVLKGIDLEVMKGQFVALVGASGCGKSTIVSMLERFYDPSKGCIRIADDDLTTLNPRKYRSQVGLVQQEPTLFQGTIRENIALGVDDPTTSNGVMEKMVVPDAEIEAALRSANAWDFVSSLPEGLSTAAGPNGTQLSGGQRQRIAIARALVRNPRILLLDEATSALDTESEKIVQNALSEAAKEGDRITIAVAHRLSTIKDADKICVFYGGRIVEQGTHAELLNGNGNLYRKMCEAQSLA